MLISKVTLALSRLAYSILRPVFIAIIVPKYPKSIFIYLPIKIEKLLPILMRVQEFKKLQYSNPDAKHFLKNWLFIYLYY